MLGSPPAATATLHTSTSSATPTSPTRPSRLRGLSYLRSYTHNHLSAHLPNVHSRPDRSHSTAERPALTRSASSPIPPDSPRRAQSPSERAQEDPGTAANGRLGQAENGQWVPTVQGRSGLRRDSLNPTSESRETVNAESSERIEQGSAVAGMVRSRTLGSNGLDRAGSGPAAEGALAMPGSSDLADGGTSGASGRSEQPTVRFIPHIEPRSTRPSLNFTALSRTLKHANSVVKVGRYSERDNNPRHNSDADTAPVGFKSKVVSRRHCEFWCTNGQWFVKDVKSSSGTFLNHVRLSAPGQESRPFPVNDGDVVQLGIDFKGGEEVIFRCVKIRVECNRGWQKTPNNFNTTTHKMLLKQHVGKTSAARDSDAASVNTSECSICLNPVAPCQALFVAPCSHVWHYKCVRNLIHASNYPNFLCPNCRFVADLEADVEPPEDETDDAHFEEILKQSKEDHNGHIDVSHAEGSTDDVVEGASGRRAENGTEQHEPDVPNGGATVRSPRSAANERVTDDDLANATTNTALDSTQPTTNTASEQQDDSTSTPSSRAMAVESAKRTSMPPSTTQPMSISRSNLRSMSNDMFVARSMTPTTHNAFSLSASEAHSDTDRSEHGPEGPMTPRNDAGPFVFDGSGGRASERLNDESVPDTVPEEDDISRRPSAPSRNPDREEA